MNSPHLAALRTLSTGTNESHLCWITGIQKIRPRNNPGESTVKQSNRIQKSGYAAPLRRAALALTLLLAAPVATAEAPVEVMILGTYHMANPGQDVHNMEADDVTTDAKQAELAAVSRALQAFAPTKVAVEHDSDQADLSVPAYADFEPGDLREKRNETVQVGYRLAHDMGHDIVYGIDEQSEEINYFPYGELQAYAEEHGGKELMNELNSQSAAFVQGMERAQATQSIAGMLMWINQPTLIERLHGNWYYGMLEIGDGENQPGALVNGRYYLRNAKIFAKLTQIAEPGDRIVVIFGSGHNYWLRHLVTETPGYELVEPNDFLAAATP